MRWVLGGMDVARVNPYRYDQGTPGLMAWFVTARSAAVTQLRGRHQGCHLPGERRPPGLDYIGRRGRGWRLERRKRDRLEREIRQRQNRDISKSRTQRGRWKEREK